MIDLKSVRHFSSAALGMLIALNKVLEKQSGQLRITNVSKEIFEVFLITKLHRTFTILDSTDAAMASFG